MKNPKLKIKPLALSLLGGLSLTSLSAQATTPNTIKEASSTDNTTKTYTYTKDDSSGTNHYISKLFKDTEANLVFEVNDQNLEFVRNKEGDPLDYGALGLTVSSSSDRFAGPTQVDFNISNFKKVENTMETETNGIFLRTLYESDKLVVINSNTNVTGEEVRTVTVKGEKAVDKKAPTISAFSNLFWAPGTHNVVINAANTTYKATTNAATNISGISQSIQHKDNILNFDFKSGTVDVDGNYHKTDNGSKVYGVKVESTNIRSTGDEAEKKSTVDINISGGKIKAQNGQYAEGVGVHLHNLVIGSSNINIKGGDIQVAAGRNAKRLAGSLLEVTRTDNGSLSDQVATNTQSGGTITVDGTSTTVAYNDMETYGIATITDSDIFKSKVVQSGGTVNLIKTRNTDNIAGALYSVSKNDAEISQTAGATATATGADGVKNGGNNAVAYAESKTANVIVDLAGTGEAVNYGVYTKTQAGKTSTINLNGTLKAETAVFNNEGNSTTTVDKAAIIGKADQKSKFSLGLGDDNLIFNGTSLDNVGELDGGQDADVNTDFDTLTLTDYSNGLELGDRIRNWEKVELKNGSYTLSNGSATVGQGTSTTHTDKVGGIEVDTGVTLETNAANITGAINNKGTTTLAGNTTVTGLVNNAQGATATLNQATVTGSVENDGTLNVTGDSSVTSLNNKENATVTVSAGLTGELNNKGTATLNTGANVTGTVNNEKDLTVAGDSTVTTINNKENANVTVSAGLTGELNNKGTATLNQGANVTGTINNEKDLTVAGDSTVTTLNNKANATVDVNAALTGDLNNQADATANLAAKLTGNLNNEGTANLNSGSEVEGTVTNAKDLTLANNSKVTGTLANKANATATLNQATVAGTLNNEGTVNVADASKVTTLNNKENATVNVNAALTGDVNNQGTATVANGAKVLGTINNEQTLTLEDGSSIEGTLNNKADATATINQVTITKDLNNAGTATLNAGANIAGTVTNSKQLTVAGDSTVGSLTNQENATVEVNANLTGNLTNKGTANVNSNTFTGNLANESTGTLNLNKDTTVTGTLDNQGKAILGGTVVIKDTFTNTGTAVLAGDITAQNGINNEAGAKLAIDNTYAGNLTNKGETIISGKQFTGNLTNEGTAQLKDGLNLAGVLTNTGTTKVDGQVTVSSLNNNSVVDLRSETAGKFSTLTVAGDLDGNGTVKVNAKLDGNHKTDHDTLAVQGNVNGTTIIEVTNTGDKNVDSNGIEGVELVSLADTSKVNDPNQAFKLLAPVESGIYEYNTLAYNTEAGKKGFYLRSVANRSVEVDGRTVRLYRQAAVAYALNQQINSQAIHDVTTNLHQRQGEQRAETNYLNPHQSWVRVLSNKNHLQADNLLADSGEYGIQIGWDFNTRKGGTSRSGLYGVYTKVDSKIGDNYRSLSNIPGKIDTDLASLGLYNTTYFGNSYLNLVAAFNYLYSDYEVHNGGSQKGFGGAASIEAGSKFALANNFFFEPQIQVSYQFTHYQDFQDVLADIEGFNHQSLRPRAGFRLGYSNVKGTNLWLHANLEFEALKAKNFNIGHELIATKQASKTIYDLGLNGQVALSPTTVLYGSAQYKASLGKKQTLTNGEKVTTAKFHGFGGEVGLRFTW